MSSKEEIEKAKERLSKKLEDEKILGMLAHIDKIADENILNNIAIETLLQYIDQLEQENNKQNKIIDEIDIQKIKEVPNMEITKDITPAVIEIYKTVNQLVKAVHQLNKEVGD